MAHMMKFTKGASGHMFKHFERGKDAEGSYIKFGNQEIDTNKSYLNYNLALNKDSQGEFVKKRCSEVRCLNRKDINIACSWVVSLPKDYNELNPGVSEKEFFKATYNFLNKRYGEENVISSYVHMDETTPHMHYCFVPVVRDKKKGDLKVSAKECVNKTDLMSFHTDLQKALLERQINASILNQATIQGNLSIKELKRKSAEERLKETQLEIDKMLKKAQKEIEGIKDSLMPLKTEFEAKKAFINEMDKYSDVSYMYPDYTKVTEKGVFKKEEYVTVPKSYWEAKHVSATEKHYLKAAITEMEKNLDDINEKTFGSLKSLEKQVKELSISNRNLNVEIKEIKDDKEEIINRLHEVLGSIPKSAAQVFKETWRESENRDWGITEEQPIVENTQQYSRTK